MNPLRVESLSFRYPNSSRDLFTNLTAIISSSDLIALYGGNGSGKTTLARILAGLLTPTTGTITFPRPDGWNGVGLLMQDPRGQMVTGSVRSEIAWGLQNLRLAPAEIAERVDEAIDRFDLRKLALVPPERLSDGERQLVGLASMLAMKPDVLLLDEATAFLDPEWRARIWEVVRESATECGVLWVTARGREIAPFKTVWRLSDGLITMEDQNE